MSIEAFMTSQRKGMVKKGSPPENPIFSIEEFDESWAERRKLIAS